MVGALRHAHADEAETAARHRPLPYPVAGPEVPQIGERDECNQPGCANPGRELSCTPHAPA
jgi:hypothetical protein